MGATADDCDQRGTWSACAEYRSQAAGPTVRDDTLLKTLAQFRDEFTFISGASHPDVGGGHQSGKSFLTAAKHPNSAGFKTRSRWNQVAAEQLGVETRFSSLALTISSPGLSWSRDGVEIPAEAVPSRVFRRLFLVGKPKEKAAQVQRLQDGQSVLDVVMERSARMRSRLSGRDRDQSGPILQCGARSRKAACQSRGLGATPQTDGRRHSARDQPDRTRMLERLGLMYDMMHLAIETDSTRFITFYDTGMNAVPEIEGVDTDYHMLSHHAKDPTKIAQLTILETEVMRMFAGFLKKLADSHEGGSTLLNRTMVLFGSNLGNASSHNTKNMPMILAGGGFKHGQHLAFDQQHNYPLPKLYVSMLQRLGLETDTFASCTGTMDGLEMS